MKAYIKVDITKELPEENEQYCLTNEGWIYFGQGAFISNVKWFLKEIDLSELMIEFRSYSLCASMPIQDLLKKFLEEKGYIIIE